MEPDASHSSVLLLLFLMSFSQLLTFCFGATAGMFDGAFGRFEKKQILMHRKLHLLEIDMRPYPKHTVSITFVIRSRRPETSTLILCITGE